jgi:O-acetylhomoserine (thiol)-lyase
MAKPRTPHFDTLSLHAGAAPDPATGARATPIYQSASFVFPDGDHAAALFDMERPGHVYSRISNPTCAVLEERIAALEGGVGAIATASGQAAMHLAIVTLLSAGSHIVASRALYGGSHNLLDYTLPRFGIDTTFVDGRDLGAWRAAIQPNTRLLFGETLGNPALDVLDIPRIANLAHEHGVPLLVDSTFTTPFLMQPFAHGADLVFHSATKFLSGHGVVIGGLLVDSGRCDWSAPASAKFPTLTEPYRGFTTWCSARNRQRPLFCCGLGAKVSATSARAWRRSPHSRSCRDRNAAAAHGAACRNTRKVVAFPPPTPWWLALRIRSFRTIRITGLRNSFYPRAAEPS